MEGWKGKKTNTKNNECKLTLRYKKGKPGQKNAQREKKELKS